MGVKGIDKQGVNSAALTNTTMVQVIDIGTNQAFQIEQITIHNADATNSAVVEIYDAAAAALGANLPVMAPIEVGPEETVTQKYDNGHKFYTELSAGKKSANGTIDPEDCEISGKMF